MTKLISSSPLMSGMLMSVMMRSKRWRGRILSASNPLPVVIAPVGDDTAVDGTPNERHEGQLLEAARSGAGLVLTIFQVIAALVVIFIFVIAFILVMMAP